MLDFGDKVVTHLEEGKHGRSDVFAFLFNNMCGYVVGKKGDDVYHVRLEPNGNVLMFTEDELEVIKQMDNWKYNVGDEILFDDKAYIIMMEIEGRYVLKNKATGFIFGVPREEIERDAKPVENQKEEINMQKTNVSNAVEHPSYYQGKIEVIDFIEDKGLGFNLGNSIKYIARAGKKNPEKLLEDLKKARWYLDREIARIEKEGK